MKQQFIRIEHKSKVMFLFFRDFLRQTVQPDVYRENKKYNTVLEILPQPVIKIPTHRPKVRIS